MTIGVYAIEHVATGRHYVGKSLNVEHRVGQHYRGRGGTDRLQRALSKYGRDAFRDRLLEVCLTEADASEAERRWIVRLDSRRRGFNVTDGGDGSSGYKHTPETKAKMRRPRSPEGRARIAASKRTMSADARERVSAARLGRSTYRIYNPSPALLAWFAARLLANWHGRPKIVRVQSPETRAKIAASKALLSPESRARISAAQRGRTPSAETRAKMSAAHTGKRLSDEHRAHMSAARMGHGFSDEARARMSQAQQARRAREKVAK